MAGKEECADQEQMELVEQADHPGYLSLHRLYTTPQRGVVQANVTETKMCGLSTWELM